MSNKDSSTKLLKREVRIHTRPMTDEEYQYVLRMFAFHFDQKDSKAITGQIMIEEHPHEN